MSELHDGVPAPLARRMEELLTDTTSRGALDGDDPGASRAKTAPGVSLAKANADVLAAAGVDALRRALSGSAARATAADLLAADALITGACADAATSGIPDALAPEAFAALLEEP